MTECGHCHAELPAAAQHCAHCGYATSEPADELIGTELLGRYRIVRLLAEGGMGRVYVAEQAVGSAVRRVAIKVLRRQLGSDSQLAARFAREAETLVRLTHPNTVQLFDFGALPDGTLALVMEYVHGHSLSVELRGGPLPLARVQRILSQICGALKEAHAHGIVHRDLKPDNVLIADREGHADFVKVLDFGIASVSEPDLPARTKLTQQGMMVGTPPYMSPEQFMGEAVDARSDLYSLALIAYELLSGRLPFEANTPWEWASKHMTEPPLLLTATQSGRIAKVQARAIERALAKKPDDRPANVDAFLSDFLGHTKLADAPLAPGSELSDRPAGVRSLAGPAIWGGALALLCVAGLFVAGAFWAASPNSTGPQAIRAEAPATTTGAIAAAEGSRLLPAQGVRPAPPALPTGSAGEDAKPARTHSARADGAAHVKRSQAGGESHREAQSPATQAPAGKLAGTTTNAGTSDLPAALPAKLAPTATATQAAVTSRPMSATPPTAALQGAARDGSTGSRASAAANVRAGSTPLPGTVGGGEAPADLQNRVAAIREAAAPRPEVAIGLYQAAVARYGSQQPMLLATRTLVRESGSKRIATLLAAGRCPQAQALQRALASIQGAAATASLFGSRCPAP